MQLNWPKLKLKRKCLRRKDWDELSKPMCRWVFKRMRRRVVCFFSVQGPKRESAKRRGGDCDVCEMWKGRGGWGGRTAVVKRCVLCEGGPPLVWIWSGCERLACVTALTEPLTTVCTQPNLAIFHSQSLCMKAVHKKGRRFVATAKNVSMGSALRNWLFEFPSLPSKPLWYCLSLSRFCVDQDAVRNPLRL